MIEFLHHFFLPRVSNNYRPKLLHHKFLLFFILLFFSSGLATFFVRTNFPSVLGISSDVSNQQLLILTNQDRLQSGLPALTDNQELDQAAANKAADMFAKDYWAHNSPTGATPWDFIKGAGYNYVYAGENLARGYTTSSDVINAWMASPEHRQNMLSPHYQNVGFAVATGKLNGEDTVLVVEMFGSSTLGNPVAANLNKQPEVAVASNSPSIANTGNAGALGAQKKIQAAGQKQITLKPQVQMQPLVDSASFSLLSSRLILSLIIFVLILDMIAIERKKIVRFVGHNLDHVIFFSAVFAIIIILVKGAII